MSKKITKKDVHNAADKANISWDNDPEFLNESRNITGKEHLDDMSDSQLSDMLNKIENDPDRFKKKSHFTPGKFKLKSKNEKGEPEFEHFRTNHDYDGDFLGKVERKLKRLSKTLKKQKNKSEAKELDSMIKNLKPKYKK
jgi:hypothetical protein